RSSLEQFRDHATFFSSCHFQSDEKQYRTAMSFGYALSLGEIDFTDLVSRAETACQIAKSKGDGKCVEWTEEIERQAIDRLRARCDACGSLIDCAIPRR